MELLGTLWDGFWLQIVRLLESTGNLDPFLFIKKFEVMAQASFVERYVSLSC